MLMLIRKHGTWWSKKLKQKLPSERAIMAVHIYGLTVDMEPLLNLAKKYKLKVIEDAAEVIGQTYKPSHVALLVTLVHSAFIRISISLPVKEEWFW